MFEGTYRPNRRPVETSAPDCLVYINGELSLPSGSNPNRRVDIQPMLSSVSVNLSTQGGSGSASLELHVPRHHVDDIYSGGQLILTTMMEVQIYMKGQFLVNGAPQFYPVFWGITTSVNESYSAGETTVSISCSDILYWWEIQQINLNPSWMAAKANQTQKFNLEGNYFTRKNPYSIMYTLSRRVYGDSMNVRNLNFPGQNVRSEALPSERRRLMAYWSQKWGRIGNSLRMYGPTGQVLQGDLLDYALDPKEFLKSKKGRAARKEGRFYEPFEQGDINFADVTPFSLIFSQLQSLDLYNSEFETKLNLANQVKESIGYEFFMDVTGELIFKPPFYNMDTRPNYPVSWIRPVDTISSNFAENPPDVTFIEATGFRFKDQQVGLSEEIQPKATYVDYRLVQKFGWKPGSFSSEFIGADDLGGPKALFFHLVDILDRQNAKVNNGTITLPLRPELRLGYPVYVEDRDAYYYVEGLSHTFSYGSRCTTQVTLMARRQKFYGDFGRWETENQEPRPGDVANPGTIPQNMYKRPIDETSGTPKGDRNVVMTYVPETDLEEYGKVETFEDQADDADTEVLLRNLVNLRSQFGTSGANKYVYLVDPNRDEAYEADDNGQRQRGPITHIEADAKIDVDSEGREIEVNAAIFPVSDERGYEVVGTYEYGRRATLRSEGFEFDKNEDFIRSEGLTNMAPNSQRGGNTTQSIQEARRKAAATAHEADVDKHQNFLIDPNNYGRLLTQVRPPNLASSDLVGLAQTEARRLSAQFANNPGTVSTPNDPDALNSSNPPPEQQGVSYTPTTAQSKWGRKFKYNSDVAQWRTTVRDVRNRLGLSEEDYPDDVVLAFIHTESAGDASARRTNVDEDGNESLSQFVGLLQIGRENAEDFDRKNTDFMGNADLSIQHFFEYQETYRDRHNGDPRKQAILWKGGPETLRQYNELESNGATAQELETWLANYPPGKTKTLENGEVVPVNWGVDEYASRVNASSSVWRNAITGTPPDPDEIEEDLEENIEEVEQAISEPLDGDEADEPKVINTVGLPSEEAERQIQVDLFESKLQANLENGIDALPSDLKPPRDPSVIPIINRFLTQLYERAFQEGGRREAELRGETTQVQRPNTIPTAAGEPEREFVDTPLSRKEIQEALDNGETLSSLFAENGAVQELQERFDESINTAETSVQDAGQALSDLAPNTDDEDS